MGSFVILAMTRGHKNKSTRPRAKWERKVGNCFGLDSLRSKANLILLCCFAQELISANSLYSYIYFLVQQMSIIKCSHTIAFLLESLRRQRKKVLICVPLKEWLEILPEKPHLASLKKLQDLKPSLSLRI